MSGQMMTLGKNCRSYAYKCVVTDLLTGELKKSLVNKVVEKKWNK